MKTKSRTAFLTFATTMFASGGAIPAEGPVVWADTTCDYFIIRLPEGDQAEAFGERNGGPGELLVRVTPTRVIFEKNIADW